MPSWCRGSPASDAAAVPRRSARACPAAAPTVRGRPVEAHGRGGPGGGGGGGGGGAAGGGGGGRA
ncbi:hypothetical protein, partial [Nocardia asiatica]|uniref:hypothetical protein n=1 Tax=Nocardia asiatica TaxID=209252 RepID=UPI002454D3D0